MSSECNIGLKELLREMLGRSTLFGWNYSHSSSILQQHIISPVRKALDYYTEMERALERETQSWAQSENAAKSKETAVGAQSAADSHTDAAPEASKPDAQWTFNNQTSDQDCKTWHWFQYIWTILFLFAQVLYVVQRGFCCSFGVCSIKCDVTRLNIYFKRIFPKYRTTNLPDSYFVYYKMNVWERTTVLWICN